MRPFIDKERVPRGWGRAGGIFCPVCRMEAYKMLKSEGKYIWLHAGRKFPCARAIDK